MGGYGIGGYGVGGYGIDTVVPTDYLAVYLALLTSEHRGKPLLEAVLTAIAQPAADLQTLFARFPSLFDLDLAVGDQLDKIGEWVGAPRYVAQDIPNVYFTLDDASLGFDRAVWFGPGNLLTALSMIPDDIYRRVIHAAIFANHWDGSIEGSYAAYNALFEQDDNYPVLTGYTVNKNPGLPNESYPTYIRVAALDTNRNILFLSPYEYTGDTSHHLEVALPVIADAVYWRVYISNDPGWNNQPVPDPVINFYEYAESDVALLGGRSVGVFAGATYASALTAGSPTNHVMIVDNQDMTMEVKLLCLESPDALTSALFTSGYLKLKPAGVACTFTIAAG